MGLGRQAELVEDEQEQAPELTAEFYPANGSSSAESAEASPVPVNPPPSAAPPPLSPQSDSASNRGNGSESRLPMGLAHSPCATMGTDRMVALGSTSFAMNS